MYSVSQNSPDSQSPSLKIIREDGVAYDTGKSPRKFAPMIPQDLICEDIDGTAVQVYCILAAKASTKTGLAELPEIDMANQIGKHRSTITRALKTLHHFGFVDIIDRRSKNLNNQYFLPHQIRGHHDAPTRHGDTDHVASTHDHDASVQRAHVAPVQRLNSIQTVLTDKEQKEVNPPTPQAPRTGFPDDMMAFWNTYPAIGRDRSSKRQVLAEWKRINPSPDQVTAILSGLRVWCRRSEWCTRYCPGAHRFLNLHKWEELPDESPPPKPDHQQTVAESNAAAFARVRARLTRHTTPDSDDIIEIRGTVR